MKDAIQIILILDFPVMLAHTALLGTSQHHMNSFSLIPHPRKVVKKTNSLSGCYPFPCSLHITIPPFRGVSRAVSVVASGLQGSHKTKKSWGAQELGAKQPYVCTETETHMVLSLRENKVVSSDGNFTQKPYFLLDFLLFLFCFFFLLCNGIKKNT